METYSFKRKTRTVNQKCLLYLLSGHPKYLPEELQQPRKRLKEKQTVPAFITSWKPEVLETRPKINKHGPANPNINIHAVIQSERHNKPRTHSDKIEEFAKRAKYFNIMSNRRTDPPGYNQSPCHRDMLDNENPKIGPAPMRN